MLLRSHDGRNDVRLDETRNLTVLDQFQKVYLFLLMTSFENMEKRPEGQLRNLNFATNMCYPGYVWAYQKYLEERSDECKN